MPTLFPIYSHRGAEFYVGGNGLLVRENGEEGVRRLVECGIWNISGLVQALRVYATAIEHHCKQLDREHEARERKKREDQADRQRRNLL